MTRVLGFAHAEQSLVSRMLEGDADVIATCVRTLSQDDFHSPSFGTVFGAIKRLHERNMPIDPVTVANELGTEVMEKLGGVEWLLDTAYYAINSEDFEGWIVVIRDWSRLRTLRERAVRLRDMIDREATADEAWVEATKLSAGLEPFGRDVYDTSAVNIISQIHYAQCGMPCIDRTGEGGGIFPPEALSMVAALPGHGKTAFLIQVAAHLIQQGYKPLYGTLEQSKEQIKRRMIQAICGWSKQPDSLGQQAIFEEASRLASMSIWDPSGKDADQKSVEAFVSIALRAHRQGKLTGAILVDYAQLFSSTQKVNGRTRELEIISGELLKLAKDTGLPVIAAAQLVTPKNEPSRIADCSKFNKDASIVVHLHIDRPEEDNREPYWKSTINVAKSRTGFNGRIPVTYNRRYTRFEDPSCPPAELYVDPFA